MVYILALSGNGDELSASYFSNFNAQRINYWQMVKRRIFGP
jgi:hypothetical protein